MIDDYLFHLFPVHIANKYGLYIEQSRMRKYLLNEKLSIWKKMISYIQVTPIFLSCIVFIKSFHPILTKLRYDSERYKYFVTLN